MNLKPFGDRILVKEADKETQTKSGLIIPDMAKEKPQEGVVVAVGDGRPGEDGKLLPMYFKVGDRILYGKYSGVQIKLADVEYLVMSQDDVLGFVLEG